MKHDRILLKLPAKAEYILTVRMLAASIASRMDFSVDTLEDIKSGAAEACILFLTAKQTPETLNIDVVVGSDFRMVITAEGAAESKPDADDEGGELAKCLIDEFYDSASYDYDHDVLKKIELVKRV